jgi:hypothetical protein
MMVSLRIAVACAAATASFALAGPVQAASSNDTGAYHLFQTPEQMQRTGRTPPHLGAGEMEYFGGSVFSNVKVVSVIWGSKVNPQTVADIPDFLTALPNSTFVDQLSIYDTNLHGVHHKGTNQNIERGTFLGQVQIKPKDKKLLLTDKMVQQELEYQIGIGALPMNDLNTLYMIYFPTDITIKLGQAVSCQDFGAYHFATSKTVSPSNIFYAVMPDCSAGFGFLTFASSHEFAEATTDNIPTPGSKPKYPQAWNTSDGYEIADLCEDSDGTLTAGTNNYEVTQVYLNTTGACSTGNYTSP